MKESLQRRAVRPLVIAAASLFQIAACGSEASAPASEVPVDPVNHEIGEVFEDCPGCPALVAVPGLEQSGPPLLIMQHELTWAHYVPAMIEAGCPKPYISQGEVYPDDLTELADDYPLKWLAPMKIGCFLDWLKQKTGHTYRLPTPEEWEHAARAGSTTRFPWGDEPGFGRAAVHSWFDATPYHFNPAKTSDPRFSFYTGSMIPVKQFAPNDWGLYDVVGSLAEYVDDIKPPVFPRCVERESYEYCQSHAARGGSVSTIAHRVGVGLVGQDTDFMTIEKRYYHGADQPVGFRLVRE